MYKRSTAFFGVSRIRKVAVWLVLACPTAVLADSASAFRDPTRPPTFSAAAAPVESAAPLEVDSILISPSRRIAVINQKVLAEGDEFSIGASSSSISANARVLEIRPDSVLVSRDGKTTRLHLRQAPEVRRTRNH